MKKKILYLDMDGVVADFDGKMQEIRPDLYESEEFDTYDKKSAEMDATVANHPEFFQSINPIEGAIEAVNQLFDLYDVYFLSTPMWDVPHSWAGKRIWVEKHFGEQAKKRLILTHRKDFAIGDILVDDRKKNGAGEFKGRHIWFGQEEFPTWKETLRELKHIVNPKLRKFRCLINERGLDDIGFSGMTIEVDELVKGKIYEEADRTKYDSHGRNSKPFFVDDNGCSRDIMYMLKNKFVEEIYED